jgi:hypothetical protein
VYAGAGQPLDSSWNARGRRNCLATAAPSSDRESPERRPVRNRCEQTDRDLTAPAHWLLLVMNYSTRIDELFGRTMSAGRAEQERIDPVAFGKWHYESQSSGLRDEVSDEITCADIIAIA